MDWTTLLATALGAFVGVGSTLLADQLRWRRSKVENWHQLRREVYAQYLSALSQAHEEMRAVAFGHTGSTEAERGSAVMEAFRNSGAYALRHQMTVTASPRVVTASERVFRKIRHLRDLLMDGHLHSTGYREEREVYDELLDDLFATMRADLGNEPLKTD